MTPKTIRTPLFVRWSLSVACELRCLVDDWESPERTERLLRPLREITLARQDDRVFDGVAVSADVQIDSVLVERPLGFIIDEVLEGFGGEESIAKLCSGCPANIAAASSHTGCFGWIHQWGDDRDPIEWFDAAIDQRGLRQKVEAHFPATNPNFYGIWMPASYTKSQLAILSEIFVFGVDIAYDTAMSQFARALKCALETETPLQTQLFPSGELSGRTWRVAAHCASCSAERAEKSRRCPVCLAQSTAIGARRRKAKGVRPYLALAEFLGPEMVADFLQRYFVARGETELAIAAFFKRNAVYL